MNEITELLDSLTPQGQTVKGLKEALRLLAARVEALEKRQQQCNCGPCEQARRDWKAMEAGSPAASGGPKREACHQMSEYCECPNCRKVREERFGAGSPPAPPDAVTQGPVRHPFDAWWFENAPRLRDCASVLVALDAFTAGQKAKQPPAWRDAAVKPDSQRRVLIWVKYDDIAIPAVGYWSDHWWIHLADTAHPCSGDVQYWSELPVPPKEAALLPPEKEGKQ